VPGRWGVGKPEESGRYRGVFECGSPLLEKEWVRWCIWENGAVAAVDKP
jgi:hypothetical protein